MSIRSVMIYSRFERFWHWTQMALIFVLVFTGFGLHGFYDALPFGTAVMVHIVAAAGLMVLWVFAVFWHLTTGTWRHYLPTSQGLWRVARFYAYGIFKGEHHPYRKAFWRKHNPLQALAYLLLKIAMFPAIWITGLVYLFYNAWSHIQHAETLLTWVAQLHVISAFAIVVFIIAHVYLLTTGHSFVDHVKPMLTGYDEVDLTEAEEKYLEEDESSHIR